MYKYLVDKASGKLETKVDHLIAEEWIPKGKALIESEENIPVRELQFWRHNGKKFSVDSAKRDIFRKLMRAYAWMKDRLPTLDWANLGKVEKKLVMRLPLTEADENELLALWVRAGSPDVGIDDHKLSS